MTGSRFERLSAATGYAALLCGVGAAALERPWPSTSDLASFPVFLADNRAAILGQSLLFLLSAGFFLWFLGSLRSFLLPREPGAGPVTMIAFTAGITGYGLIILGQAPQITLTLPAQASVDPALAALLTDLGYVMLLVSNIPIAVMFTGIAVVSLRHGAFPTWLGWIAALAAVAALVLPFAVVDPTGPLAPQGWLSYLLYLTPIVWLIPATTVMITRIGRPTPDQHRPRPDQSVQKSGASVGGASPRKVPVCGGHSSL
jgi:hypothetical protein